MLLLKHFENLFVIDNFVEEFLLFVLVLDKFSSPFVFLLFIVCDDVFGKIIVGQICFKKPVDKYVATIFQNGNVIQYPYFRV